jgi:hypothetical protein
VAAKKIVTTINSILNKKKKEPISMKWKDDHEKGKQEKYILQETKTQEPEGKEINQGKKED